MCAGVVWVGGWKGTAPLTGSLLLLSLSSCCAYCFYQDAFLAQMQKIEPQGWSVSQPLYKQTLDSLWLGSNSPGPSKGADSSPPGSLPACRQGKGGCLLWGSSFWGFCHRHRMVTLIETWGEKSNRDSDKQVSRLPIIIYRQDVPFRFSSLCSLIWALLPSLWASSHRKWNEKVGLESFQRPLQPWLPLISWPPDYQGCWRPAETWKIQKNGKPPWSKCFHLRRAVLELECACVKSQSHTQKRSDWWFPRFCPLKSWKSAHLSKGI